MYKQESCKVFVQSSLGGECHLWLEQNYYSQNKDYRFYPNGATLCIEFLDSKAYKHFLFAWGHRVTV